MLFAVIGEGLWDKVDIFILLLAYQFALNCASPLTCNISFVQLLCAKESIPVIACFFSGKNCAIKRFCRAMNQSKPMGYPHVEPPQYSINQPPPPPPPQYTPNPVIIQPSTIPPPSGNSK